MMQRDEDGRKVGEVGEVGGTSVGRWMGRVASLHGCPASELVNPDIRFPILIPPPTPSFPIHPTHLLDEKQGSLQRTACPSKSMVWSVCTYRTIWSRARRRQRPED